MLLALTCSHTFPERTPRTGLELACTCREGEGLEGNVADHSHLGQGWGARNGGVGWEANHAGYMVAQHIKNMSSVDQPHTTYLRRQAHPRCCGHPCYESIIHDCVQQPRKAGHAEGGDARVDGGDVGRGRGGARTLLQGHRGGSTTPSLAAHSLSAGRGTGKR